jgi:hypothetical protein
MHEVRKSTHGLVARAESVLEAVAPGPDRAVIDAVLTDCVAAVLSISAEQERLSRQREELLRVITALRERRDAATRVR